MRALIATAVITCAASAAAGPLAMHDDDQVVLGRDTKTVIHLHSAEPVQLVTNVGTISHVENDAATLTLPAEQFPQRAIVAAIGADGDVRDWLAIPLAGQARVKIDTEPLASVIVRVGTADFGPVQADARGVANVDIIVPPGIAQATAIATGKRGAIREKPVPLGVAPFQRILVVCGPLGDRVWMIATTPAGAPVDAAPKLASTTGSLAAPIAVTPGVFVAEHRADAAGSASKLSAAFPQEESLAATCDLVAPPELPNAIQIVADRPTFVAGSGALALAIKLVYPGMRHPLAVSKIDVAADTGTLAPPERTQTGWTATWTLPDGFAGRHVARATARVNLPGGAHVETELRVELVAGTAVRIDVSAPERVRANGAAHGEVVARVVDKFGNVVPSKLESRSRGHVGTFAARADGAAGASYVAPLTRDPGDDVLELSDPASGLTARTTIRLDALPRRFAFSARVGYLSNLGRVSAPIAAVSADARLPILDEHAAAGIEVAGYSTSIGAAAGDTGESVSGRITAVPVLARVAYRTPLGRSGIDVWAGAGVGVAFASTQLSSASAGMEAQSATRFAATGFAGGALRAGPGWIVVEGAYLHATLPDNGPIAGRLGGVIATAGFALEIR